jgi:hypothetical protein
VAVAAAIRIGYTKLSEVNEYFYKLNDADLKALLVQVTGDQQDSSVVNLTFGTLKNLKHLADFDAKPTEEKQIAIATPQFAHHEAAQSSAELESSSLGLNLSYTINLNLPATSDQAVFNAIFRSLKEFLITDAKR